jgi:myo-inositol-1(or 4)-monophosphatase
MKSLLISALRSAGEILRREQSQKQPVRYKTNHEAVTRADTLSDQAIQRTIVAACPRHAILSEERPPKNLDRSDWLWIIDPLDGTNNYLSRNPIYSVNIALARKIKNRWQLLLGGIYLPATDDLYFAENRGGAWLNGKRLRISKTSALADSKIIFCHGYTRADVLRGGRLYAALHPRIRVCRMLGAAGVEMSLVAAGGMEGFLYSGAKAWDIAAGALLVREAGGRVRSETRKDWQIGDATKVVLVSNQKLSGPLLSLTRKAV